MGISYRDNTGDCHEPNGSRNDDTEKRHYEQSEESGNQCESLCSLLLAAPLKDPLGNITPRWRWCLVQMFKNPMILNI